MKYIGKTDPYDHQREAFQKTAPLIYAALFMEQGTGKTKVAIDRTVYNFERGKIQVGIVICPKSLTDTWIEEIATHCPDRANPTIALWDASLNKNTVSQLETVCYNKDPKKLCWLIINIEGIRTPKSNKLIHWMLRHFKCHVIVDESSKIKSHNAKQSEAAHSIGDYSTARTILTGTPVGNSPADYFSQLRFLMGSPLGHSNFYSFRATYCELETKQIKLPGGKWALNPETGKKEYSKLRKVVEIIGVKNSDQLKKQLLPFSFFVKKADCLDLPPKIYHERTCALSKEGMRLYKDISKQIVTEIRENEYITVEIALSKLLRLQQVVGGFLPSDDDPDAIAIPGPNPKIDLLLETIEQFPGPSLIWSRFKAEHIAILKLLKAITHPSRIGEITGRIKKNEREDTRRAFQRGAVDYIVCTQSCAGYGYTLTAAVNEFYYSNTFSHEQRVQSEDRAHRISLTHDVNIVDLFCPVPGARIDVDMKLKESLRIKKDMADMLTDVSDLMRSTA